MIFSTITFSLHCFHQKLFIITIVCIIIIFFLLLLLIVVLFLLVKREIKVKENQLADKSAVLPLHHVQIK